MSDEIFLDEESCQLKSFEVNNRVDTFDLQEVVNALKQDCVVKVAGVEKKDADTFIRKVSSQFGLFENLEKQSLYASIYGHRQSKGQYYMTVNSREDYQYIPSHSEGTSKANIQLASLYCIENTTDGGYSILSKVTQDDSIWNQLGEYCIKVQLGSQKPSVQQIEYVKSYFNVDLVKDILVPEDKVIEEIDLRALRGKGLIDNLELRCFHVISEIPKVRSKILDRDVFSYWDSVASYDLASGMGYHRLMQQCDLLRGDNVDWRERDNASSRRIWDSGVNYSSIFDCKLKLKLKPKEIVIFNNLSWTHSATNWTLKSGNRLVLAAFA